MKRLTLLALLALLSAATPAVRREARAQPGSLTPQGAPAAQSEPGVERDEERRVRVQLRRGARVALDNRSTGRIVAVGWDRDYVEAVATSERGTEYVLASSRTDDRGQRVWLKADYLTPRRTFPPLFTEPAPTPQQPPPVAPSKEPPAGEESGEFHVYRVPSEVHLEVKLPRYAELELITVNRSDVEITGVRTAVAVSGRRSDITLRDVGGVEVRTERGSVEVEGAAGLVDVVTTEGPIYIRKVRGDVRAISLSGKVDVRCVSGRVSVSNTEGPVALGDVDGDVDATTVNSDILLEGRLRQEGRYHLKSMSGSVEMGVRANPPGFTALLSSYRGTVESDFKLDAGKQPPGSHGTRHVGRQGDGRTQITLDSFDGRVKLRRLTSAASESCR